MPTTFQQICIDYLTELRNLHSSRLATNELSLRPALDKFIKRTSGIFGLPVLFVGEPKKIEAGKPDFTAISNDMPIGYIEAEAYGTDLDNLTGHAKEQNERFRMNLDNFLLTNYLEFRLYVGGELADSAKLSAPPDKGAVKIFYEDADALEMLFERFLSGELPPISLPRDLATHLARRTRQMRNEILLLSPLLTGGNKGGDGGDLYGAYQAFKDVLLPDLNATQFADMYAQTIAYGLFAARCVAPQGKYFSRQSAADLVPKTNPFLRRLFQRIAAHDLDQRIAWIADDIARLLAQTPIKEILANLGKRTGKEDPVVHFYETFLAAYDSELREVRGVYYTPEPVVSYIVRSIDHLLKTRFNKPMGLADENTFILDPATGTGSFLFAVVNLVRDTVTQTIGAGAWSNYVDKYLLTRLFGFELLVAPYTIAHLKLSLLLKETCSGDFSRFSQRRVGIYLTNTLEEAVKKSELLMGKFISDEANEAAAIKLERPILVVLGNPPYSGHSANRSRDETGKLTFIGGLIEDYKKVDGKTLGERNPKWLQDDYVKFIRFAQWRIEGADERIIAKTGEGIIGYITNHGYLDNPTFRGMRQNLMQTFNEIYVYNLHGNVKKKEKTPDGGKDENVFDIQQGVAILLCVKFPQCHSEPFASLECKLREESQHSLRCHSEHSPQCHSDRSEESHARIYHADLWGLREGKYKILTETDVSETQWTELQPTSPFYLFVPQDTELLAEYEQGWKVTDILPVNGVGMTTARDHVVIDYEEEPILQRATLFRDSTESDAELCRQLGIPQKKGWNIPSARRLIRTETDLRQCVKPVLYRPFDIRLIFYHDSLVWRTVKRIMHHMLAEENLALVSARSNKSSDMNHFFCSKHIMETKCGESTTQSCLFPLYLYPDPNEPGFDTDRRPNFSPAFLKALAEKLNLPQTEPHGLPEGITPEDIFHYAYAMFHSSTYRERYAEFLKIDFPRLQLTNDLELFRDLAAFGKELVALHLLDTQAAPALNMPTSPFPIAGSNKIELARYMDTNQRVYINKTQYFDKVPSEVWEFHIGGYQVCEKWLKDRKGRILTIDDLQHYQRIVVALSETIRLMDEIEERIPGFPME
ncbi:DNA methyltransferase [Candidatus Poribacteria bacterium]|nr:DNA methyltransferase [Candidatus Poribacteria bacterium]